MSPAGSVIAQRLGKQISICILALHLNINVIYQFVAKKTGKMFFVSYNLPKDVQIMQEFVERKITDRLKSYLLTNNDQQSK